MNWIKQNTFNFGLIVAAIVGAIVFWIFGSSAASRYEAAQEEYQSAYQEAQNFEKLDPYPSPENLQAKKIAVQKYGEQTEILQKAFDQYRPGALENTSPQAFSTALKQANEETLAAFGADTKVPDSYFCGFKDYRNSLPAGNATGILNYQLGVVKQLMLNLAEAEATELVSLHRAKLPEEENKPFKADDKQVARALPMEVVFKGSEASVRKFLSSLVNDKERYLVVRSLRVANEKAVPPRKTDARFEGRGRPRPGGNPAAPGNAAPDFNALFNPDGAADKPKEDAAKPEGGEGAEGAEGGEVQPQPAPVDPVPLAGDNSRILAQVLGQEELEVFVRIDLLLFLESKELP